MSEQRPTFAHAAEVAGYQSFFAGRRRETNPYTDIGMRQQWFRGFDHGVLVSGLHLLSDGAIVDGYMAAMRDNLPEAIDAYRKEGKKRGFLL